MPGNWSNSGTSPLGPIAEVYGTEASGGTYFKTSANSANYKYISAAGVVSDYVAGTTGPSFWKGVKGFHSTYGLFGIDSTSHGMRVYNEKERIMGSASISYYSIGLGAKNDRVLMMGGNNGGYGLYSYNFKTGEFINELSTFL
ncbi:hypothetical protein EBU99_14180, partial [bacterium]|nr:hypothetical protein [bacterium]